MSSNRENRFHQVLSKKQVGLSVILENVVDSHNIAAVFRSCDAVGIHNVYVIHDEKLEYCKLGKGLPTQHKKTAGRVVKWMNIRYFESLEKCFEEVRKECKYIFSTHLDETSKSLYELDLCEAVALLFGNEKSGVTEKAISLCDGNFIIPQVGMAQSLNVSVACAVSLYEALRQRKIRGMYDQANLPEKQRVELATKWMERDAQEKRRGR